MKEVIIRRPSIAGDRPAHVEEGVEIGVGKSSQKTSRAALAAPHSGEPVVDERDFHVRVKLYATPLRLPAQT